MAVMELNRPEISRLEAGRDPRIGYALSILLDRRDGVLPEWPKWLHYGWPEGRGNEAGVYIVPSELFGEMYGTAASLPTLPLEEIAGVPLLFGKPLVERRGDALIVHADILASSYFLLTRYEDWIRRDVRDEHGRFSGLESLPHRAGFLHRPIVDEYVGLLRGWAREVGVELPPPDRRFSVLLTHDIDYVGPPPLAMQGVRSLASAMLGRQSWKQAARSAAVALRLAEDPLANLDTTIEADRILVDRVGADRCRTAYFFIAENSHPLDANYDITSPKMKRLFDQALASGADIGIHASYLAGEDPRRLAAERAELERAVGRPITKNRHHFLRWREVEHSAAIAAAGIAWDTTLGYNRVPGFRLGVCHPIPLFDASAQRLLGIEEHPLVAMDCTLSDPKYMGLSEDDALTYACRLADATFRHQGEFVMLWHNTLLAGIDGGYHPRLYRRILAHLAKLLGGNS